MKPDIVRINDVEFEGKVYARYWMKSIRALDAMAALAKDLGRRPGACQLCPGINKRDDSLCAVKDTLCSDKLPRGVSNLDVVAVPMHLVPIIQMRSAE